MLLRTVVEHVLYIGHYMLLFEEVALIFGFLELVEHLLNDLTLTPFDVPVFCVCVFSAHNSVPTCRLL